MADVRPLHAPRPEGATGVVVFADGRTIWGHGFGAEGEAVGELCFNTAMTGYQEVMTDPSYAKQVIAFTFPHIGNVGANDEDVEAAEAHALGCLVREVVTEPSNYRANYGFADWMRKWGRIGIAGVDTRALTRLVRTEGPPTIAIAHSPSGQFDLDKLQKMAAEWPGLEGMDLAKEVSRLQVERWTGGKWAWGQGFGAEGEAVGELCFNTAMTGYQEVMTDPSYAKQVIAFTFPHIGNVGANDEDVEAAEAHALGCLVREVVTEPSNYRANYGFADWMRKWGRIGIAGVDTRALTKLVRTE
ncbi:MAG TPA: carbamoyl-phosphate synthase domain-containing protein, partial [Sphingomicrobium sp.]